MALRVFPLQLCIVLLALCSVNPEWASARTAGRDLGVYRPGPSPESSGPSPDTGSSSSPSSSGGSSPYPTTGSPASGSSSSSPGVEDQSPPVTTSSPPYSSTPSGPSSGSSSTPAPEVGAVSPLSSPAPVVGSGPLSAPVVGSPLTAPATPDTSSTPSSGGSTGGKGSCGFWSHHGVKFPSILSRLASLASIFGGKAPTIFGTKMTLMEALLNRNHDEFSALARQGTASLLNAYAFPNAFPLTAAQVRENFSLGLQSPLAARQQASLFERANSGLQHS